MHKLDQYLLDKLDALTTRLQRKGYRLTEIYVQVAALVLISTLLDLSMSHARSWLFVFCGIIWGGWLWVAIRWANTHRDYPESHKLMERLNARALFERENMVIFRIFYGSMMTGFSIAEVWLFFVGTNGLLKALVAIISTLTPALMFYMHGCFYIGPGHFAKDQKTQLRGNETLSSSKG